MELKVGMYVRTYKNGIHQIYKIDNHKTVYKYICDYRPHEDGDGTYTYNVYGDKNIVKASYNIIDLIKVGDVIIDKEGHKYPINYEFETDYNSEYESYEITIDDNITLFFKDGLSIVTKEQFESMSYKVGD